MKQFLKLLQWTLNAAVFFTLFAFALGLVVGVLGMVPRWWRQKQAAKSVQANTATATHPEQPEASHGT